MELVGDTEQIRWIVKVAPFLSEPDHLYLSAELRITPPDEPPAKPSDLFAAGLEQSYDFLVNKAKPFAGSFMP
jgi:hypothetical protein